MKVVRLRFRDDRITRCRNRDAGNPIAMFAKGHRAVLDEDGNLLIFPAEPDTGTDDQRFTRPTPTATPADINRKNAEFWRQAK
jgi:hypothetical protein